MNNSESVLGTLKYLDDLSKRSSEKHLDSRSNISTVLENARPVVKQTSLAPEKKILVKKKNSIEAAEPHLKQFAGMISEELANIKKIQQEEIEKFRQQEIERIRLEEAEKIRLEIEREKILKEEQEKARLLEEQKVIEENERQRIKLEEQQKLEEELAKQVKIEEKPQVEQIKEYVEKTYRKQEVDESLLYPTNKKITHNLKEQTNFVTFEDLKKHYTDFLNKINIQLGSLGGGGEVLMKKLDDIDMATVQDGDFISYDATTGKFIGGSIEPGSGTIEGGTY